MPFMNFKTANLVSFFNAVGHAEGSINKFFPVNRTYIDVYPRKICGMRQKYGVLGAEQNSFGICIISVR